MTTPSVPDHLPGSTRGIPRWLHVVSLAFMAVLMSLIVLLLVGFVTAGPEENLAGVLVILAGVLAIPVVVAAVAWSTGWTLRRRAPQAAYVLVVVSVVAGGLGMSLVALWFLPAVFY